MKLDLIPFSRVKQTWEYRDEPENMRALGQYLWRILLCIAFLAILFAAWLGYQELGAVTQAENTPSATTKAPPAPLDPNALQAQLDIYTTRQQSYQTLSQSPLLPIQDPSK